MFDVQSVVMFVVGIILIILGLPRPAPVAGGASKKTKPPKKSAKLLTAADYAAAVTVAPYDDRWARGDLVADYPQCPFVGSTGIMPRDVIYTGVENLTADLPLRHWGQRKLLLTEIDFLNRCPREKSIMIYAGAADGRHIPILVEMYPHVEFHLYDPRSFYRGLDGHHNIRLNPYYGGAVSRNTGDRRTAADLNTQHGWFTDEVAEWYATREGRWCNARDGDGAYNPGTCRTLYFVSDIRTVPTEAEVELNQRQQERWIEIMRPHRSMVKYRVPYPHVGQPREYRHMAGHVRFQCWAPVRSAETRLIVETPKAKAKFADGRWDRVTHERNCAWYNWIMRGHDLSDRQLRDFGIAADGTVREFWRGTVPDDMSLGFDFVYELQILADYLAERCDAAALRDLVKRINSVLMNPGARFENYLKK